MRDEQIKTYLDGSTAFVTGAILFGAPREQSVSLSSILEKGPIPARYFLSPKAAAGILRRAEKRGKELPPLLLQALRQAAAEPCEPETARGKTRSSP